MDVESIGGGMKTAISCCSVTLLVRCLLVRLGEVGGWLHVGWRPVGGRVGYSCICHARWELLGGKGQEGLDGYNALNLGKRLDIHWRRCGTILSFRGAIGMVLDARRLDRGLGRSQSDL